LAIPEASVWERIKGWLFHAFPHHLVSRATFRLARLNTPLKDPLIRLYIRTFGVNMSEALESDPRAYPNFNAFFTRGLKPGMRPIASTLNAVACPVDGRISQVGNIDQGRLFQAKGQNFSVSELLGGSQQRAAPFLDGKFCNIYLSPRDYHRIHMPMDGCLLEMVHIPGRLFSVAPYAPRVIPRLFARNERVAAIFETSCGLMAVVMVGAVNVSAIETVWAGLVTPPACKHIRSLDYSGHKHNMRLARGQEMGRFNMGSTVILLFAAGSISLNSGLATGERVVMGQRVGTSAIQQHGPFIHAFSQEKAVVSEI
jgi:phosphatidylserine decarboxylase